MLRMIMGERAAEDECVDELPPVPIPVVTQRDARTCRRSSE